MHIKESERESLWLTHNLWTCNIREGKWVVEVGDMALEGEHPGVVTLLTGKLRWRGADTPSGECNDWIAGAFGK